MEREPLNLENLAPIYQSLLWNGAVKRNACLERIGTVSIVNSFARFHSQGEQQLGIQLNKEVGLRLF